MLSLDLVFLFHLYQFKAQPSKAFIKRLKLTRLAMADVFGRTAPGPIVNWGAIRPQADDECRFKHGWLHDLGVYDLPAQQLNLCQVKLFVEGYVGCLAQDG